MIQAGKQLYLVANWKSHKTWSEAKEFMQNYESNSEHRVVICPPMAYIFPLKEMIASKGLVIGAQDISNYPFGGYTGAVCAEMLKGVAEYIIVGHSERRKYFHETNEMVANKVRETIQAEITPILCVDEPYLESQLAFFGADEFKKMMIAYEPLAAIGSGQPEVPEQAEKVAKRIIQLAQEDVLVIYGGSVNQTNVKSYVDQEHISGVLVGGASLEIKTWKDLVAAVS